MWKRVGLAALVCFLSLAVMKVAVAAERPGVAVLPYANRAAVSKELSLGDAAVVSEFVIEHLLEANRFRLVERSQLLAITNEHKLNLSGLVDPSTAVEVGRLAGVKYLIIGSVSGLSTKKSGASYENRTVGGVAGKLNTVIANVTARVVDVETGEILYAASGTGESASSYTEFKLNSKVAEDSYDESLGSDSSVATDDEFTSEDSGESDASAEIAAPSSERYAAEHKITIGSTEFSQVQVRNALYKAVDDLIYNKNFGLLAKMDGKAKHRKV